MTNNTAYTYNTDTTERETRRKQKWHFYFFFHRKGEEGNPQQRRVCVYAGGIVKDKRTNNMEKKKTWLIESENPLTNDTSRRNHHIQSLVCHRLFFRTLDRSKQLFRQRPAELFFSWYTVLCEDGRERREMWVKWGAKKDVIEKKKERRRKNTADKVENDWIKKSHCVSTRNLERWALAPLFFSSSQKLKSAGARSQITAWVLFFVCLLNV